VSGQLLPNDYEANNKKQRYFSPAFQTAKERSMTSSKRLVTTAIFTNLILILFLLAAAAPYRAQEEVGSLDVKLDSAATDRPTVA
jgi:hypothetical protein